MIVIDASAVLELLLERIEAKKWRLEHSHLTNGYVSSYFRRMALIPKDLLDGFGAE